MPTEPHRTILAKAGTNQVRHWLDSDGGVVAKWAFVTQRLARVNVAFNDQVGVGQDGFQVRSKSS